MAERLNQVELAERFGVTRQRIAKLIADGRLIVGEDGKIDVQLAEQVRAEMSPVHRENEADNQAVQDGGVAVSPLQRARIANEAYRAQERRLRVERMRGDLVSKRDVQTEGQRLGQLLQSHLLNLGPRLAPSLAAMGSLPDHERVIEIRKAVDREARLVMVEMIDEVKKSLSLP